MIAPETLPLFLSRRHLADLGAPLGLTADGVRSLPGLAEAAEVRLSPRRPRFRRDKVLAILAKLDSDS
ncbi:hypothetical protein BH09PSE1_BH09PSE1_25070 [soil metagenome]